MVLLVGQVGWANDCDIAAAPGSDLPHIPRVDGAIRVDGVLDEALWQQAWLTKLEHETQPGENIAPPVQTEVRVAENGSHLYVAFSAHDPDPSQIRAYIRDRDQSYDDDFVGIVVDTFNDERFAFEFFANPYGAQMDLTYDDVGQNEDDSWDAIWDSAGRITASGYNIEMAIPLQQLRFPKSQGVQTWGIDLVRNYPRSKRHRIANNIQDRSRDCYLCQLQKVTGFACAEPGRNLVVAPTLTANRSESRPDTAAPLSDPQTDIDPGLDVRWGITPDLTLSGTINPDFSQVEADVAQLSINERFELFFPEKRPFFLEGADFFDTRVDAVFTRTIADPDVGLKLVGKLDSHNIGVFAARDTKTNYLFPGSQGSGTDTSDEANNALVARYRYDVGQTSALGLLVTGRDGADYSNWVTSVDGRYRFTEADSFNFQYLDTRTEYPAAIAAANDQPQSLSGSGIDLAYDHRSREWRGYLRYFERDDEFRADLGFITQVGIDRSIVGLRRNWYPGERFSRVNVGGDWDITHDSQGRVLEREIEGSIWAEGPMQSFLEAGLGQRDRLFGDTQYNENFQFLYGEFQPRGGVEIEMSALTGDLIDFDNARLADLLRLRGELELNLGRHLALDLRHTYQALDRLDDGSSIFVANLSDARVTWQFSVRSFLRLVVQHQDIDRNLANYIDDVDSRSRSLATQLLYSYKINPQTVLFLGYSDASIDGDELTSFTRMDRTLFAKIGYAWLP
ncbi:MAG: carbohydrate binding family 9 domain-containing protein [Gammaproteobacteria bacterium]|nr:carbohydrate binding family 9 domain-containing protein [Gammaproteobacteria bacterium]